MMGAVRYCDDLVVLCRSQREAECALAEATRILAGLGLEPKAAKTRIVHLAEGGEGLDFLGFHHRWVRAADGAEQDRAQAVQCV
jgi:RNA-directed DNA polymerase